MNSKSPHFPFQTDLAFHINSVNSGHTPEEANPSTIYHSLFATTSDKYTMASFICTMASDKFTMTSVERTMTSDKFTMTSVNLTIVSDKFTMTSVERTTTSVMRTMRSDERTMNKYLPHSTSISIIGNCRQAILHYKIKK